jgi:hypothetical protein
MRESSPCPPCKYPCPLWFTKSLLTDGRTAILLFTFLITSFSSDAQPLKQVITLFPHTNFIQEIYYVKPGQPEVKDGDYFSFYEGYLEKSNYKNEKIDEDRIKGIKTRGSYFNDLKDSIWTIYYPPSKEHPTELNEIETEGAYVNNRKAGIWYTFLEGGQVRKRFDADQQKELEPIVKARFIYPPKAKAHKVEGIVAVKVLYVHCIVKKYKIVKDIGYGCAKAVITSLKEEHRLRSKYGIIDVDCSKKDEIITTRFKL